MTTKKDNPLNPQNNKNRIRFPKPLIKPSKTYKGGPIGLKKPENMSLIFI